jgi:hypothetical protein
MFEDFASPLKHKGKEKDVGKRRAYVRVVTTLGGASLNLELFCEKVTIHKVLVKCFSNGSYDVRRQKHVTIFCN